MEERDFGKVTLIKEISVSSTQKIIINGVEQEPQVVKVPVVCCPNCGRVLMQFNVGTTNINIAKYITSNYDNIIKSMTYCSSCGQKLTYPTIIEASDFEVKEVNRENG